ncbi:collagen-like triple helix repeat-containing protein [Tellurirhabdus rosea]|uniref:collagen-like triple helix repeat-containing protein n=1 Tax=Tellurirhabdus rosea TaxID=2674997 RepID=UPI002253CB47|nr:collagen-like protein [Tellurirhabdus rosea]
MKNLVGFMLAGLMCLASCKTEEIPGPKGDTGAQGPKGDTGAQGPKGDTGEKGDPGTANVWTYIYTDQQFPTPVPPEYNSVTKLYTLAGYRSYTPDKYAAVAEKGAVLVYVRDHVHAWTLNSMQTLYFGPQPGDKNGRVETEVRPQRDRIQVMARMTSPRNENLLTNYRADVKIILIESTQVVTNMLSSGKVNLSDSRSVERYLHLKPL